MVATKMWRVNKNFDKNHCVILNKNDYNITEYIIYHTYFHTLMHNCHEYLSTGLCKKFYMNTDGGILHIGTFLKTKHIRNKNVLYHIMHH